MNLNNIKPASGSKRKSKRVGRGESSGWGKFSGRGNNGQKARSGASLHPAFEGGQTPYFRRIPKKGFSNHPFKDIFSEVNLVSIEERFSEGETVNKESLIAKGIVRRRSLKVKILGRGELTKKLTVVADKFSKSAQEKIEAAKGKAELT